MKKLIIAIGLLLSFIGCSHLTVLKANNGNNPVVVATFEERFVNNRNYNDDLCSKIADVLNEKVENLSKAKSKYDATFRLSYIMNTPYGMYPFWCERR